MQNRLVTLAICLCSLFPCKCIAATLFADDFQYTDSQTAQKTWVPSEGAIAPRPSLFQGKKCLILQSWFTSKTTSAAWDRKVQLDLSDATYFSFLLKVGSDSTNRKVTLSFRSGEGGWFLCETARVSPFAKAGWQKIFLLKSRCGSVGTGANWNDIRSIRFTIESTKVRNASDEVADLRIEKVSGNENLLANSSFEVCTIEKLPDHWGPGYWGMSVPKWTLDMASWRKHWGVDNSVRHSGRRSLRIISTGNDAAGQQAWASWRDVESGAPYTLSAWLKSDKPDMPVILLGQTVKVNTKWARYSATETQTYSPTIAYLKPAAEGTLWIDDVQFEKGSTATEYAPSIFDNTLTGEAVHRNIRDLPALKTTPGATTASAAAIDEHRRFMLNGKPFVPFAPVCENLPTPDMLKDIAEAGFNSVCIIIYNNQSVDGLQKFFDSANAVGLMVIPGMARGVTLDTQRQFIIALRDHPALAAWFVYDEPIADDPMPKPAYDLAKGLDPKHPAFINYQPDWYIPPVLTDNDIACLDYYPLPGRSPSVIADCADRLEHVATPAGKPSWIALQDCGYAYWISREPTAPEEECMLYMSITHGMKGFLFFAAKPLSVELWKEMKQLAYEVKTLSPVLYSTASAPAFSSLQGSIHITAKRYQNDLYIIAVNDLAIPVDASLTLPEGLNGKLTLLFENRSVSLKNGKLNDKFAGYQRHVYRLHERVQFTVN